MDEDKLENELQLKGLNAPRLYPSLIDLKIAKTEYHIFKDSCLTICCLTLVNGYTVTGESACVSAENFNAEIGQKIARKNAKDKIWALEGYLLAQNIYLGNVTTQGKI